jgi:hypothetical protein
VGSTPPAIEVSIESHESICGKSTFEGPAFDQPECVHGKLFQVLRKDQLSRRMGSREVFAISRENLNRLFRNASADILEGLLGHLGRRLFRHDIHHGVLIDCAHGFGGPLVDPGHHVDASHPSLTSGGCVEERGLEMGVQFRVELAIV